MLQYQDLRSSGITVDMTWVLNGQKCFKIEWIYNNIQVVIYFYRIYSPMFQHPCESMAAMEPPREQPYCSYRQVIPLKVYNSQQCSKIKNVRKCFKIECIYNKSVQVVLLSRSLVMNDRQTRAVEIK